MKVAGSDAPELDTLIGRTCLRGTQTRRPRRREFDRRRGGQNGGDDGEVANDQASIPRARVPVGLVHHPPGTSRATGQAMADTSSGGLCQSRTRARSILERKFQGPSPPCQRDACSGNRRRTGRRKEPHYLLRQVASGASSDPRVQPEESFSPPGGSDPDRRRSLGYLTVQYRRKKVRPAPCRIGPGQTLP